jgi:hypothetical protein
MALVVLQTHFKVNTSYMLKHKNHGTLLNVFSCYGSGSDAELIQKKEIPEI